jgi:hypothetical protein
VKRDQSSKHLLSNLEADKQDGPKVLPPVTLAILLRLPLPRLILPRLNLCQGWTSGVVTGRRRGQRRRPGTEAPQPRRHGEHPRHHGRLHRHGRDGSDATRQTHAPASLLLTRCADGLRPPNPSTGLPAPTSLRRPCPPADASSSRRLRLPGVAPWRRSARRHSARRLRSLTPHSPVLQCRSGPTESRCGPGQQCTDVMLLICPFWF